VGTRKLESVAVMNVRSLAADKNRIDFIRTDQT
jgi:hypothetical protein